VVADAGWGCVRGLVDSDNWGQSWHGLLMVLECSDLSMTVLLTNRR